MDLEENFHVDIGATRLKAWLKGGLNGWNTIFDIWKCCLNCLYFQYPWIIADLSKDNKKDTIVITL